MFNPPIPLITRQLKELNKLYYTSSQAIYEATLQLSATQIERMLPGFTIALAEISGEGGERIPHGGVRHVLMPVEYTTTSAEGGEE